MVSSMPRLQKTLPKPKNPTLKPKKKALEATRTLNAKEVAAGLPQGQPPKETPQAKIIRGLFKQHQQEEIISDVQKARFNQGIANSMEVLAAQREARHKRSHTPRLKVWCPSQASNP